MATCSHYELPIRCPFSLSLTIIWIPYGLSWERFYSFGCSFPRSLSKNVRTMLDSPNGSMLLSVSLVGLLWCHCSPSGEDTMLWIPPYDLSERFQCQNDFNVSVALTFLKVSRKTRQNDDWWYLHSPHGGLLLLSVSLLGFALVRLFCFRRRYHLRPITHLRTNLGLNGCFPRHNSNQLGHY